MFTQNRSLLPCLAGVGLGCATDSEPRRAKYGSADSGGCGGHGPSADGRADGCSRTGGPGRGGHAGLSNNARQNGRAIRSNRPDGGDQGHRENHDRREIHEHSRPGACLRSGH